MDPDGKVETPEPLRGQSLGTVDLNPVIPGFGFL